MDKKTRPATQSPSANAAGDEAARLAARLFGEEPPGKYVVDGRLIRIYRLPVWGCSRSGSVSRTGPTRSGPGASTGSSTANLPPLGRPPARSARRSRASTPPGTRASSSSPRSLQGKILCNTTRRRRHWRPRLHDPAAGSGFRITSPRIGIPESAASPPRPSGTPPWTGCTWLPPSEAIPALC